MERQHNLRIFEKFSFQFQPVGVKFLLTKPEGINPLDRQLAFCEMLKEAQESEPFYATKENHQCPAGPILLGMVDPDPIFESGQIGPRLNVYQDPRANRRIYQHVHRMEKGSVNYTAFSSLEHLAFDPDLLIVTATTGQAEILLRAYSYRTGAPWNAKGTIVLGCAHLYMYPYASGELNMMVTGLHHGMKARKTFPEGLLLITIPFNLLPEIVDNLNTIQWDLPQYSWGKEAHLKKMKAIGQQVAEELKR
jgi:uncharacterized protein (DUF169 family)